ncbi:Ferrous iron transport protein B [Dysgonomonas macrotermitis]|uniref:Ferrous iron transport protein B n=1 Tax=Dysgonomonas macrotermitis TaxID=1346286 RepID=A0A1M5FNM4_9BACT|nr:Ferrous iron transport protein B [Dysgonomonas macrotermitis]
MNEICNTCKYNTASGLKKLGEKVTDYDYVVALAGNPNTGKSTVFNTLTGLRQHTGNWPGKTVATAMGSFSYLDKTFKLVDLPGTYSLLSTSEDEEIARDFILFGKPDVTIVVADAGRLERNLNLALQILEITDKAVLCLNLMDEAARHGVEVDDRTLARDLGIPVVPTTARSNKGMDNLLQTIYDLAENKIVTQPHRIKNVLGETATAIEKLSNKLTDLYPGLPNSRWIAMRLLEGDTSIITALKEGRLG